MRSKLLRQFIPIFVLCVLFSGLQQAHAFRFEKGEVEGFVDTTLSTGFGVRLAERNHGLIGQANGGSAYSVSSDDGNRNWSKGSVFSFANKGTSDIGASYQNLSTFVRLSYFFDPVTRYKKEMNHISREKAGESFELLDAYVQGQFQPAGKKLDIRIGKQVLNWGEALYIPGGMNVINAVDVAKLRLPGSEIREALLPTPMISESIQLTERLSLSNYYIFKYDRTMLDVCGTFFATDDVICEGSNGDVTTGFGLQQEGAAGKVVHRSFNPYPSDQGQFGVALRYFYEQLHDSEFGLYFMNYHNHVPVISAISSSGPTVLPSYIVEYLENLQVIGFTVNTDLPWGVALQSEYSYKPKFPLQIESNEYFAAAQYFPSAQVAAATAAGQVISGYREMPVNQFQATLSKSFGQHNPFKANDWSITAEAAMIFVSHFPDKKDLRFDAPDTNLPAYSGLGAPALQDRGWADRFSWAYVVTTSTTYEQILRNVDLIPRIAINHNVQGVTPSPAGQFVEGRVSVTASLTANYLDNWSLELSYTNFSGAGVRNSQIDRDFAGATLKYWF